MAQQKLIVTLVLIVVAMSFMVGFLVGFPGLQAITLDTNSQAGSALGIVGSGTYPGPDGERDELLDASQYVTSWRSDGRSEKIVFQGQLVKTGSLASVHEYRYRVYVTRNGVTWDEIRESPYSFPKPAQLSPVTLQSIVLELTGPIEGGLRVVLEGRLFDAFIEKGWYYLGHDQAYLRSGIGTVSAPKQAQIGDTVQVCVTIGYVASELQPTKGWYLYGYSSARDADVLRVDPILRAGTSCFSYKVDPKDFGITEGCTGNRIEWHLWNELWERDFAVTTTIDVSAFAPSLTIDEVQGERVAGKPMTIVFHATPNPTTQIPIKQIEILYGFGGIEERVTLPANATSYTISPAQGGTLHVELFAVDGGCRPSPSVPIDVEIRDPRFPPSGDVGNVLVFVIVLILVMIAAAVLLWSIRPPLPWAVLVMVAAFILALILASVVAPGVI